MAARQVCCPALGHLCSASVADLHMFLHCILRVVLVHWLQLGPVQRQAA